jgi:prepilin-type N-terminal cleavage/methylation domain-containing protein
MIKQGEKGMTLIELLVATAIMAMIIGVIGLAIYQFLSVTERSNSDLSALHGVENAARWISRDGQMAEATDLVPGAPHVDSVRLNWTDGYGALHSSAYSLSGTELERNYDGTVITVARHISAIEFSINGDLLTVHIESSVPGRWHETQEMTYKVCLRSMGEG